MATAARNKDASVKLKIGTGGDNLSVGSVKGATIAPNYRRNLNWLDADQCGRAWRGQIAEMDGISQIFSALRTLYRALPIVLGIAIILTSVLPASSLGLEHCANKDMQAIAISDHSIPVDNKVQDHKANATCNPCTGCFAFTVPAEEVSMRIPRAATIEIADITQLVTRIVAPPLPPPKIIILV
jgi:hypothetical protein